MCQELISKTYLERSSKSSEAGLPEEGLRDPAATSKWLVPVALAELGNFREFVNAVANGGLVIETCS